jgi:hypothetical protein
VGNQRYARNNNSCNDTNNDDRNVGFDSGDDGERYLDRYCYCCYCCLANGVDTVMVRIGEERERERKRTRETRVKGRSWEGRGV